jgi:hypothetical protein
MRELIGKRPRAHNHLLPHAARRSEPSLTAEEASNESCRDDSYV